MSLIHGYTTGFWVGAAIFGAGAVVCGTLSASARSPPLARSGPGPRRRAAGQEGTSHPQLTRRTADA
jgi:hypothetical protein